MKYAAKNTIKPRTMIVLFLNSFCVGHWIFLISSLIPWILNHSIWLPPNVTHDALYVLSIVCRIFSTLNVHLILHDSHMLSNFSTNTQYIQGSLFFFYLSFFHPLLCYFTLALRGAFVNQTPVSMYWFAHFLIFWILLSTNFTDIESLSDISL